MVTTPLSFCVSSLYSWISQHFSTFTVFPYPVNPDTVWGHQNGSDLSISQHGLAMSQSVQATSVPVHRPDWEGTAPPFPPVSLCARTLTFLNFLPRGMNVLATSVCSSAEDRKRTHRMVRPLPLSVLLVECSYGIDVCGLLRVVLVQYAIKATHDQVPLVLRQLGTFQRRQEVAPHGPVVHACVHNLI